MLGTIVNALAVLLGGLLGFALGGKLLPRISSTMLQGLGLCCLFIGMKQALQCQDMMVLVLSITLGGFLGETLRLDLFFDWLGLALQQKVGKVSTSETFSQGFISATLLFCVGAMPLIGALESGLSGNHEIFFTKAILDGISSILFASTLGIGVVFAAAPVFLYQGGLTLLAGFLEPLLSDQALADIGAVGGILVLVIGMNLLKIVSLRTEKFLPAVVLVCGYHLILAL